MKTTQVRDFKEMIQDAGILPTGWRLKGVINDDNMTFVAINDTHREVLIVDPMREDLPTLLHLAVEFRDYRFVGVLDTHTHADHVSCAATLAETLGTPLIMHQQSPSKKVHIRISRDTIFPTSSGEFRIYVTPGHTGDSLTPVWGPFIFGGDTFLYGDTGRDDLPGGDPASHYESAQKIKSVAKLDQILLPGHDEKGRVSTWRTQLEISAPLSQDRETFIKNTGSWVGPSPKLLKESLYENFK